MTATGALVLVVAYYSVVVVWIVLVCITLRFLLARKYTCLWMWLMVTTGVELVYLVALGQRPVPWYATRTVLFFHYTLTGLTLWFLGIMGLQTREWFRGSCLFTTALMVLFVLLLVVYLFPHEQPPDMVIHMSDSLLIYGSMITAVALVLVRIQVSAQWVVLGCLLMSILVSVIPLLGFEQDSDFNRLVPATRCFFAWIALYIALWIHARHFPWALKRQSMSRMSLSTSPPYHPLPVQSPQQDGTEGEEEEGKNGTQWVAMKQRRRRRQGRSAEEHHEPETSWDMQQALYSHDAERLNAWHGDHQEKKNERQEMDKRITGLRTLWKRDPTRSICMPLPVLRLAIAPLSVVHLFYVPTEKAPPLIQSDLRDIYRQNVSSAEAQPWFHTTTFRKAIRDTSTVEWQIFVSRAFDAFHDHFNTKDCTVPLHVLEWLLIQIHLIHGHGMASPPSSFPLRLSDYIQTAQYITDSLIRGQSIRHLNDTQVEWAGRDTLLATGSRTSPSADLRLRIRDAESLIHELGQCPTLSAVTALYTDHIQTSPQWILPLLGHIETKIKERTHGAALWHRLQIPTSASFTLHPWYPLFRWFCAKYRRGVLNENITGLEHREIDSTLEQVAFELTERLEALHDPDVRKRGIPEESSPALTARGLQSSPMFPAAQDNLSRDEQRSWLYPIPYSRIPASGGIEPQWEDDSVFVLDEDKRLTQDQEYRQWLKEFGLWACWIWRAVLHTDFCLWRTETILHLHVRSLRGESRSQHLDSILTWVERFRADTTARLSMDKILHSSVFAPPGSNERSSAFAQESTLFVQEVCGFLLQRQTARHAPFQVNESEAQKLHGFILSQARRRSTGLRCSADVVMRDVCERLISTMEMLMGTYNIQSHWSPSVAVVSLTHDWIGLSRDMLLIMDKDGEGSKGEPTEEDGEEEEEESEKQSKPTNVIRYRHEQFFQQLEQVILKKKTGDSKEGFKTNTRMFTMQNLCETIRSDMDRRVLRASTLGLDIQFLVTLFCAWFVELEAGLSLYMLVQGWISVTCESHIQKRASAFHRTANMAFPNALMSDAASRRSSVLDFNRLKILSYQQAHLQAEVPAYVANPWVIPLQAVRPALISSAGSSAPPSGRTSPQLDQDDENSSLVRGLPSEDEEGEMP